MGRGLARVCLLWCLLLPFGAFAQAVQPDHLPSWLTLAVELQGRAEFDSDSPAAMRAYYLNRLRVQTVATPVSGVKIFFEGQDVRPFHLRSGASFEDHRNSLDMRQGYLELGQSEEGWRLRVGRQELAIGDERLIGADGYWDGFGQTFDAVRVVFSKNNVRVDTFVGFQTEPGRRRPDAFDTASRVSGASLPVGTRWGTIEPYVLWRRAGETFDLMQRPGHRDVVTSGMRGQGDLPWGLDYNVEMAVQRGHVVGDRIVASAGHWEIGWKPLGRKTDLRLGAEFNIASGDDDPGDGTHETFDDLYPAGFNKYGIVDPFAWRNIRYPSVGAEIPLTQRLTVAGGFRSYWLATVHDGLYPGGDDCLVFSPDASSSHMGNQAFFSADYRRSEHWRLSAGYGHLWPGSYLRQSGYRSGAASFYLLSTIRF